MTGCVAAALAIWTVAGCSGPAAKSPDSSGVEAGSESATDEVAAALAQLSPEDRALAESQRVCVVSHEALGSMGKPVTVEHDGKKYFLCCEGCRGAFEKNPEEYIARLEGDDSSSPNASDSATEEAPTPAAPESESSSGT